MNQAPDNHEGPSESTSRRHRRRRSSGTSGRISRRRGDSLRDVSSLLRSPVKGRRGLEGNTSRRSVSGTNLKKSPRGIEDRRVRSVPQLFAVALKRQWAHVVLRCTTHPEEAEFVRRSDGLTALHLAVISRASYSKCETVRSDFERQEVCDVCFKCDDNPAPLHAIQALVKAFPGATRQRCHLMGYTPLAYACLVPPRPPSKPAAVGSHTSNDSSTDVATMPPRAGLDHFPTKFDPDDPNSWHSKIFDHIILGDDHGPPEDMFDEAEGLIRTLLEDNSETLHIQSNSELTPADIHVISFSQMRGAEEASQSSGTTTTSVLRTLLETDPSCARSRFSSSFSSETSTAGPLEYLYRWNAAAILEAVERQDRGKAPWLNKMSSPSRRASLPSGASYYKSTKKKAASTRGFSDSSASKKTLSSDVGSWWIWQWAIILLKYSVLHVKKRGAPFSALHAAAYMEGCPLALLLLIVRMFPAQIKKRDEMVQDSSMLPLQIVCCWGRNRVADAITASRKGMAIGALLAEYPDGAKSVDSEGRCALFYAIESKTTFDGGIRKLIKAHPKALRMADPITGLFPFILSAANSTEEDSAPQLRTIYELLRTDPRVLEDCFPSLGSSFDSEESSAGWADFGEWNPFNIQPNNP